MKLRTLASLVLAGTLLLSTAGCSNSDSGSGTSSKPSAPPSAGNTSAPAAKTPAPATENTDVRIGILIPGSPTDGGFSQQGAEAGKKIEETFGYTVSVVQAGDASTIQQEAETMADEGYKIVYGHGGQCSTPFAEISGDYPDTWFITFGGTEIRDNLFPVCMNAEEGTYVLGVIAGMMSDSGTIAYTLGGDYPAYTKTTMGWALGAKSVNPDIVVKDAVLSSPDANECYETTLNQIKSGADIILSNSNEGQAGALKAVNESEDIYTFGCLGDFTELSPDHLIANIIGDYGVGYLEATKAVMDGTVTPEIMYLTMDNGCVSIVWNDAVKATLPDEVIAAAEQTIADIKSGKIDVPNEYEQDKAQEMLKG